MVMLLNQVNECLVKVDACVYYVKREKILIVVVGKLIPEESLLFKEKEEANYNVYVQNASLGGFLGTASG